MLQQVMSVSLLAALTAVAPAPSQIRAGSSISGRPAVSTALQIMVANPYSPSAADSVAAVAAGDGLRDRLGKGVGGDYAVIPKKRMNDALTQYGYPADAILTPTTARMLASQLSARLIVTSTLSKAADGRMTMQSRVTAMSLDVGHVVTTVQAAGQSPLDFGAAAGAALAPVVRAMTDAKACADQATTKADKAVEAANKALKAVPNLGSAEYCLAQMAQKKDSAGAEAQTRFQNATKGDPLSLLALNDVAIIYQMKKDSAKTIETFQQMLRVAPTNQALREESYKLFQRYGKPDAAMEVAEEGIRNDPTNPDWYDFKSNVCLMREDYTCAIAQLEQAFQIDTARADTSFYVKILYATKQKPDTAKYLQWAQRGAAKYETNADIQVDLLTAQAWSGNVDGAVATASKVLALDPEKGDGITILVKKLVDDKRIDDALKFAPIVKQRGNESLKNDYAGLMITAVQPMAQDTTVPRDKVVEVAQAAISVGPTRQDWVIYGNYFTAVALYPKFVALANSTRQTKSCDQVKEYSALVDRIEPTLAAAAASTNQGITTFVQRLTDAVKQERPEIAKMQAQFCK